MRLLVSCSLLMLAVACQTAPRPEEARPETAEDAPAPQEDIVLTTDRSTYAARDSATLTLRNEGEGELGYNLCMSRLQRRVDGEWRDSEVQLEEVCIALLQLMPPGGTDSFAFQLPARLPPGEYRFATRIEDMRTGRSAEQPSTSFRVEA